MLVEMTIHYCYNKIYYLIYFTQFTFYLKMENPNSRLHQFLAKIKRKASKHLILTRIILIILSLSLIIIFLCLLSKPIRSFFSQIIKGPKMITTFFSNPLYTLPSYNGITNVLFLGMGGEGHDGALLTDTIILFSLNLKTNSVVMLSIPRDIWVPSIEAKINSAYMFGENQELGGGYAVIEDAVYEIIDMPIHYIISIDFASFEEIVDTLGGVDLIIDRSFTDEWYPLAGKENDLCNGDPEYRCRYETISFSSGNQHMDGVTALKFSRSRHADGDEGTDFARSQRQQKIITAIKEKLLSPEILLNPKKIIELKNTGFKYVKLNKEIEEEEIAAFASFGYNFYKDKKEIKTITLETGDLDNPGFLVNPPITKYGSWVLEARKGDWLDFNAYFKQKVEEEL